MPVELYALVLLISRIISIFLSGDVIRKQIILRKRPINDKDAYSLREDMYKAAWVTLLINIIPAVYDVLTLFGISERPQTIMAIPALYVFSFAFGSLALSYRLWRPYRNALDRRFES